MESKHVPKDINNFLDGERFFNPYEGMKYISQTFEIQANSTY